MSGEYAYDEEESEGGSFLVHIPTIVKQRKWFLIVPGIIFLLAGIAAAFLLPTIYRSKATLLVEAPMLPQEIAEAPSADVVDQRIAKIRQQVLSRPELIELIQKNGLYTSERSKKPLSEVIEKMRDATTIEPLTSEIQQRSDGKSSTIAFSLSFGYSDPIKAQTVAQDFTEQVLLLDATKNSEQAANTVQFLTDQATGLQQQIAQLEMQISGIKARNGSVLSNAGMTMLGGGGGSFDAQIAALQRDNAQLNQQRDLTKTSATRDPVVANAEASLAAARAVFSETHPDVILAKQRLAEAKELAARNVEKIPTDTIASQIAFNNSQIAALQAARSQESSRLSSMLGAQSRAPAVLEQIAQIQQRLDGLNTQYQGVSARLLTAQAGAKAESEQKGERLSVIDPPVVPEKPDSPNRPLLIAGGLAAGLGLGLVLVLALEMFFRPIRDVGTIKDIVGELPLVVIPTIKFDETEKKRWFRFGWPFGRKNRLAEDAAA